jgi:hypothetical protein
MLFANNSDILLEPMLFHAVQPMEPSQQTFLMTMSNATELKKSLIAANILMSMTAEVMKVLALSVGEMSRMVQVSHLFTF